MNDRPGRIRAVAALVQLLLFASVTGCAGRDTVAAPIASASPGGAAAGGVSRPSGPTTPSDPGATPSDGPGPAPSVGTGEAPAGVPAPRPALLSFVAGLPGTLGMEVRDRVTGRTWQAGKPRFATWTASTIKLALATAVLESGITLTGQDTANLRAMLENSSNEATDALWATFDGNGLLPRFRDRYGMSGLSVVAGYEPHWRHLQCSAADLAALMTYALGTPFRAELTGHLRAAAARQPWGVWAAGSAANPGHKPGWALKPQNNPDHWVVHSVGFAGPGERYVLAIMYDLPKGGTSQQGAQAVTDAVTRAMALPPHPVKGP